MTPKRRAELEAKAKANGWVDIADVLDADAAGDDSAPKPARERPITGAAARFVTQPGEIEIIKRPTPTKGSRK